jgi:hypothetical protein
MASDDDQLLDSFRAIVDHIMIPTIAASIRQRGAAPGRTCWYCTEEWSEGPRLNAEVQIVGPLDPAKKEVRSFLVERGFAAERVDEALSAVNERNLAVFAISYQNGVAVKLLGLVPCY